MTYSSPQMQYARPEASLRQPRDLEYDLLARATKQLLQAWENRETDFPALVAALHSNEKIWAALAADVADPGNALPAALRAQLFYLYEFTAKHSALVLSQGASVLVLTDINTAVMRGLRGSAPQIGAAA